MKNRIVKFVITCSKYNLYTFIIYAYPMWPKNELRSVEGMCVQTTGEIGNF